MAPRVVYDDEARKANQALAHSNLHGSVAALVGSMVAATEGFSIHNPKDVAAVQSAFETLMQPWFEAVQKSYGTMKKGD